MDKSIKTTNDLSSEKLYHGTKANLKQGDLIGSGYNSKTMDKEIKRI
jgi:hypothetical protein